MSSAKCEACEENFNEEQRKPRQLDCGCIICEKCIRGIYKLCNGFQCRKHNVTTQRAIETLPILNLVSQQVQNSRPQEVCQIHQWQLLGLYCPLDKVRICVQCQQEFHQGHGCITEYEAIQLIKTYLESSFRDIKQRLGNYKSTLDQGYRQLSQWQISRVEGMVQVQQQVKKNIKQACQKIVKDQQCQIEQQIKMLKDTSDYYYQIGSQINAISNSAQENIVQVEEKRNQLDQVELVIQDKFQQIQSLKDNFHQDNQSIQALYMKFIVQLMEQFQPSEVYQSYIQQVNEIRQLQLTMKQVNKDRLAKVQQEEVQKQQQIRQISSLEQKIQNQEELIGVLGQQSIDKDNTIQELNNCVQKMRQESEVQQQRLKEKDRQLCVCAKQSIDLQQQSAEQIDQIQKLKNELAKLQQEILNFKSQVQEIEAFKDEQILEQAKKIQAQQQEIRLLSDKLIRQQDQVDQQQVAQEIVAKQKKGSSSEQYQKLEQERDQLREQISILLREQEKVSQVSEVEKQSLSYKNQLQEVQESKQRLVE